MSDAARQRTGLPLVFTPVVACPAGEPIMETIQGSGVHCAITDSEVTSVGDPGSIINFCCSSHYKRCPVWQAEKERIWAGQRESLIVAGATKPQWEY